MSMPEIPKIPEMQKAISRLRMLLAAIKGKEDELEALSRQFKRQLDRAPRHAIHGGNPLEATLNIMGEIQERLDDVQRMRSHLAAIKKQAEDELQALNLTDKIEQAKTELANLKSSRDSGKEADRDRIAELERFIEEASMRAAQAITGNFNVPEL
jgi:hypothetical protein